MTTPTRSIAVRWYGRQRNGLNVLAAQLQRQITIKHVLDWCVAQSPKLEIGDMITQDEYTHDFIVRYRESIHLVYDTT